MHRASARPSTRHPYESPDFEAVFQAQTEGFNMPKVAVPSLFGDLRRLNKVLNEPRNLKKFQSRYGMTQHALVSVMAQGRGTSGLVELSFIWVGDPDSFPQKTMRSVMRQDFRAQTKPTFIKQ